MEKTFIHIEFWQLVGFLLSFLGICFTFGKMLLAQFREQQDERQKQQERLQGKAPANFAMVFSVALFMFFMGGLLFHYIQLQTEVNTRMHRIEQKKKEIEKLKQKNDALQNAINAALDPEKIYTVATEELGMVYPGENQVIEYKKQESEYVRQYENIPKH